MSLDKLPGLMQRKADLAFRRDARVNEDVYHARQAVFVDRKYLAADHWIGSRQLAPRERPHLQRRRDSGSTAGTATVRRCDSPDSGRHIVVTCHSGAKPKGDLRLDQLKPDFADEATREHWLSGCRSSLGRRNAAQGQAAAVGERCASRSDELDQRPGAGRPGGPSGRARARRASPAQPHGI